MQKLTTTGSYSCVQHKMLASMNALEGYFETKSSNTVHATESNPVPVKCFESSLRRLTVSVSVMKDGKKVLLF